VDCELTGVRLYAVKGYGLELTATDFRATSRTNLADKSPYDRETREITNLAALSSISHDVLASQAGMVLSPWT
jgi:hypothetical protein